MKLLPIYPDEREMLISDGNYIIPELRKRPCITSDCNFTNLFAWRFAYQYKISRMNSHVIIRGIHEGRDFFLPPVGDHRTAVEIVKRLFEIEKAAGKSPFVAVVPEWLAEELKKDKAFSVKEDRDNFDYVYAAADLAELPGAKYHDKKNLIAQLEAKYKVSTEPLNNENCLEAIKFADDWCEERDCAQSEGLENEHCAIYQMLSHFEGLKLNGILARIDGKIVALTMGEPLNEDTYVIHVEKGTPKLKGIYQFINREFAKTIAGKYKWINREQDLGLKGLRKAKESYNPDHFVKKYKIELIS